MITTMKAKAKKTISYLFSALAAAGGALQNYSAIELLIRSLQVGFSELSQVISIAGGLCNGMVNFFMNVDLLESFLERITGDTEEAGSTKKKKTKLPLTGWRKFRYYAGIFVFAVTGVLFGMMAFAFSAATPLSILALAAGVFVAIIMTIQEIETWLQSFDDDKSQKTSLKDIIMVWWSSLTFKKACGHLIALGNVVALSLLFTISLAEVLIAFQVAAFPALVIGFCIAFTVGAFTEFYFYNFFLADFCNTLQEKWVKMKTTPCPALGIVCITANAVVNAALTYAGVGLLTGALALAGIAAPPLGVIIALAVVAAIFAGSASFILGMDFWIRKLSPKSRESSKEIAAHSCGSVQKEEPLPFEEPKSIRGLCFLENMNPLPTIEKDIPNDEITCTL